VTPVTDWPFLRLRNPMNSPRPMRRSLQYFVSTLDQSFFSNGR